MLFGTILLSALVLSPSVLAAPGLGASVTSDRRSQHQSKPKLATVDGTLENSPNWAGAVWNESPDTFTTVTGTFTVPTPSGEEGSGAAAWVGIDGDSCQSAILQTGISLTISNGQPTYTAWYEWYPAPAYDFTGITISAGDVIELTVTATSSTSGNASIQNLSNGEAVFQELTSDSALCGQDAEWIVEDYELNNSQIPFANFGTVTFTNAQAGSYTPNGANIFDIELNNEVLTSVSTSGSSVTIQYVL